uniref:MADF domain-containing protein n=1 Tax=Anopheles atroparvus TaxID=41427 RepID=A0A182J8G5_ANOAO
MAPKEEHLAAGSTFNVVKFIQLMKEYPIPPARQSKVEVDETWKLLEREMKIPRNILERKRHNLIGTYRRELRLALTAGQGFVSKWPHFQAMDFMRNDILSRMKSNHTRQCGRAAGIRNGKIIDKRCFGELTIQNHYSYFNNHYLDAKSLEGTA